MISFGSKVLILTAEVINNDVSPASYLIVASRGMYCSPIAMKAGSGVIGQNHGSEFHECGDSGMAYVAAFIL
jgi:hypothetical protein